MNILPKKRWHVRNQDNKERVRRDEENARLEQKKEEERIALAEQEARISLLRKQNARIESPVQAKDSAPVPKDNKTYHLNLFATEEESGGVVIKDNEEYIKEKKKEKEIYEQKIGLLTYVGQSAAESKQKTEKPWYLKNTTNSKKEDSSDSEKEVSKKTRLDPMLLVEESLKQKKRKKDKKKKKKKSEKAPSSSKASKSIEDLRAERMKREKIERQKADQLLRQNKGEGVSDTRPELDPRRYSNQFNPDLARKRKFERHHPY